MSGAELVGRDAELAQIRALVRSAGAGTSGVLVLAGPAGIGKTMLLEVAVREAREAGIRVLRTRGYEGDANLPYGALLQLLRPVLDLRHELPAVQRRALGIAFALEEPAPLDPFAVPAAVLNLLSVAAGDGPLLVVADDLQWVDEASRAALLFAAHRFGGEGVVAIATTREDTQIFAEIDGLPTLRLAALDRDAAIALVTANWSDVPRTVAATLAERTDGNPLALVEIPGLLTEAERTGREAIERPLPLSDQLERGFGGRIARLPEDARRALLIAAMLEDDDLRVFHRALAQFGLSAGALVPAERAGLVSVGGERIEFRHPLVRSAVQADAADAERRAVHGALAGVLDDPRRRAWQLALSQLEPDEAVAAELVALAQESQSRGAHSAAARAWERAATLSPDPVRAAERHLAAARGWHDAGNLGRALERLDAVGPGLDGGPADSEVLRLRAQLELRRGNPLEAHALLVAEADRMAESEPARAGLAMVEAAIAHMMSGDMDQLLADSRRAGELARRGGAEPVAALADILIGETQLAMGLTAEGSALLARREPFLLSVDPLSAGSEPLAMAGHSLFWIEEWERSERVLDRFVGAAREHNAFGKLVYPLAARSQMDFRRGRWVRGLADADEAVQLARATGQLPIGAHALSVLAEIEAALGLTTQAQSHAGEALELTKRFGLLGIRPYALRAAGLDHLGQGRIEEAVTMLAEATHIADTLTIGTAGLTMFMPDHVEALVLARRPQEAGRVLDSFRTRAGTGGTWAPAALARCEGLLAGDDEFEAAFERSLALHAAGEQPFERARTELLYGERLRRLRRRVDARGPLASALERFTELGAVPWQHRAQRELLAAGGARAEPGAQRPADALTPAELQVALMVARGHRNREVAASLFISEKTVERHLTTIYRKLGIRSRAELAGAFAGELPELVG